MLKIILPPRCVLCSISLNSVKQPLLCTSCRHRMHSIPQPACKRCLKPFESKQVRPHLCSRCMDSRYFDTLYAFGTYEDGLVELIHDLKFGKHLETVPVLGSLLAGHALRTLKKRHYDCVIPVPVHRRSLMKRGFNHAQQLSRYVRSALKTRRDCFGLVKLRRTPEQAQLNGKERLDNLTHAFYTKRSYHGESCLLVDDVFTTGATAENCARALKAAGALRVDVLTLARTV